MNTIPYQECSGRSVGCWLAVADHELVCYKAVKCSLCYVLHSRKRELIMYTNCIICEVLRKGGLRRMSLRDTQATVKCIMFVP